MSKAQDNGGPAFPTLGRKDEKYMDETGYGRVRNVAVNEPGITMRDYFAAKALEGDWAAQTEHNGVWTNNVVDASVLEARAVVFYRMADAMLKARA